jgi:hypothetical protein
MTVPDPIDPLRKNPPPASVAATVGLDALKAQRVLRPPHDPGQHSRAGAILTDNAEPSDKGPSYDAPPDALAVKIPPETQGIGLGQDPAWY